MTRLLCVGDLHLDKGARYGRAPGERLAEQEAVWARALELSREHRVDAVLFAGDAFEKRHPSTDALLAFERPLVQHQVEGGATVIAIPGNHDRSGVTPWCALDVFSEAGLIELLSRQDALHCIEGVWVACLPWAPVSRIVAAADGGDRDDVNAVAAELLLEAARELRASVEGPCVLLTHFSISGAVTPDGADVGMFREPILQIGDLEAVGFDAVIAGHIHKPQLLTPVPVGPTMPGPIFYVGSPMPLDFGEAKCEHGVYLLDIAEAIRPHPIHVDFHSIESRRFVTLDLDAEALEWFGDNGRDLEDAIGITSIADAFVKARIHLTEEAARRLDVGAFRKALIDDGAHSVFVELDVQRELRARVAGLDETVSDVDALELWLDSQGVNGDQAPAIRALHTGYLQQIS